ncbi:hypothetical protein ACJX0J_023934, partial [Zea mays]
YSHMCDIIFTIVFLVLSLNYSLFLFEPVTFLNGQKCLSLQWDLCMFNFIHLFIYITIKGVIFFKKNHLKITIQCDIQFFFIVFVSNYMDDLILVNTCGGIYRVITSHYNMISLHDDNFHIPGQE